MIEFFLSHELVLPESLGQVNLYSFWYQIAAVESIILFKMEPLSLLAYMSLNENQLICLAALAQNYKGKACPLTYISSFVFQFLENGKR